MNAANFRSVRLYEVIVTTYHYRRLGRFSAGVSEVGDTDDSLTFCQNIIIDVQIAIADRHCQIVVVAKVCQIMKGVKEQLVSVPQQLKASLYITCTRLQFDEQLVMSTWFSCRVVCKSSFSWLKRIALEVLYAFASKSNIDCRVWSGFERQSETLI